jgi:hypothetical protein
MRGPFKAGMETVSDRISSDLSAKKRGHRIWRRGVLFAGSALTALAASPLIWNADAAAPAKSKKAGDEKAMASTDTKGSDLAAPADKDVAAPADKNSAAPAGATSAAARLKIQDAFSVDQPVTVELLAALKAKRPPGKQPFKPVSGSNDPVMDLPMAK